ncbi:MAG: gamma-glutamyltransferase, partial [Gemmatimonadota bacterium]
EEAVEHPRLHVDVTGDGASVVAEPGLALDRVERPVRTLDEKSLTFGGVTAALGRPDGRLEAAADSRRSGGTALGGRDR